MSDVQSDYLEVTADLDTQRAGVDAEVAGQYEYLDRVLGREVAGCARASIASRYRSGANEIRR